MAAAGSARAGRMPSARPASAPATYVQIENVLTTSGFLRGARSNNCTRVELLPFSAKIPDGTTAPYAQHARNWSDQIARHAREEANVRAGTNLNSYTAITPLHISTHPHSRRAHAERSSPPERRTSNITLTAIPLAHYGKRERTLLSTCPTRRTQMHIPVDFTPKHTRNSPHPFSRCARARLSTQRKRRMRMRMPVASAQEHTTSTSKCYSRPSSSRAS